MFSVLYKLGWFFKQYWQRYTIGIVVILIANVLDVIPPKLVGDAIDAIQLGTLTSERLIQILLFYGGVIVALYLSNYIWQYQLFGGSFLIERILRSRLMSHFLKMTPTFFERYRTGDLMARATNDLKAVSVTAGFGILTLVDSSMYMLTILLFMGFVVSWKLTLAAIIPLPILALLVQKYGKILHERFTKAQDAFGEMNDQVLETIAGIRVIRAYVQEKASEKRFQKLTDDVFEKNVAVAKIDSLFDPTVKILVSISFLIGLGYGAHLVFHHEITLGDLVSFNVYLGMLIWPMFATGELINVMQRGNASLDRVNETLAYEPDVKDEKITRKVGKPTDIIFKDVTFQYPSSEVENLSNVSFTLHRGQTLGIVGKTGSGKTTLLKQLLREYPSGKGEIRISGIPIDEISLEELHSWIGYVPQDQILFSRTVRENILFGRKEATEEELKRVLELASFTKDVEVLPQGLDTIVGEKGIALSGGQKQRVAIARALLINPEILLLDDAMSAVDGKTEAEIIRNIRQERSGKTTFIVAHRLSAVQHADWILVLDEGRIIQEGTHEQLIELDGWYKEQFERQQAEEALLESR